MTALAIGPEESVVRLSRLRLADDMPMAIEHTTAPARFLPAPARDRASLYEAFAAAGHVPARGLQRLRAVLLSDEDSSLLGVPPGSPVLYIQRIAYLADGRGVELTRSYYRSDTYEFVSEVTPGPQSERTRMTLMAQEIAESGAAIARLLERDDFAALAARLRALDPCVVVTNARGSSDHCALYLKYLLEIVVGLPCASIGPSIASLYRAPLQARPRRRGVDLTVRPKPRHRGCAGGGQGGGALTLALVNDAASPLAQQAEALLPLAAGEERSVAATKSVISALAASAALVAAWRGDAALADAVAGLPARLTPPRPAPAALVDAIARAKSAFVLGRGATFAIAAEAALKLKETCALHAEAFSAAEVMHGPAEIVRPGFLVLAFPPRDEAAEGFAAALARFAALGARVIAIEAGAEDGEDRLGAEEAGHPLLAPIDDDPSVLCVSRGGGAGAWARSRPAAQPAQSDGDALMRIFVGAPIVRRRSQCATIARWSPRAARSGRSSLTPSVPHGETSISAAACWRRASSIGRSTAAAAICSTTRRRRRRSRHRRRASPLRHDGAGCRLSSPTRPQVLEAALDAGGTEIPGSLGVHVEGPFIDVRRKGAHPAQHIRHDDRGRRRRADRARARVVTLAPARFRLT